GQRAEGVDLPPGYRLAGEGGERVPPREEEILDPLPVGGRSGRLDQGGQTGHVRGGHGGPGVGGVAVAGGGAVDGAARSADMDGAAAVLGVGGQGVGGGGGRHDDYVGNVVAGRIGG